MFSDIRVIITNEIPVFDYWVFMSKFKKYEME